MQTPQPKSAGGDFKPAPAGAHRAVCVRFIDIGSQDVFNQKKGVTEKQHKVLLYWELSDEFMEDRRLFIVQKRYTWSMHEKANLRKDLESWRGKPYTTEELAAGVNTRNMLGQPATVTVMHAADQRDPSRIYANVVGVAPLAKGWRKPEPASAFVYLALEPGEFRASAFDELSDSLKVTIAKSPEYQAVSGYRPAPQSAPPASRAAPLAQIVAPTPAREREPGEDDTLSDDLDDEIPF